MEGNRGGGLDAFLYRPHKLGGGKPESSHLFSLG